MLFSNRNRTGDGNIMKKIVVLDGYAENPGDLSWDNIAQYGNLIVYE